jgi:chemosensory pili system protein ChpE
MLALFFLSLWVGIVFCAPPGAITAEAIRRGVARGFLPALFVELGSLVGDATWAAIALVGLAMLVQNPILRLLLALVGTGLLLYLARGALQDAQAASLVKTKWALGRDLLWGVVTTAGAVLLIGVIDSGLNGAGLRWERLLGGLLLLVIGWRSIHNAHPESMPTPKPMRASGDFATGAVMSLGNPWNIVFWVGIGSSQLAKLNNPQAGDYVVFFAGFMAGAVLWCFFMSSLIAWGRQFITPTFFRRVNILCGLLLGWFALQLVVKTVFE